jgi:hypothetical protein
MKTLPHLKNKIYGGAWSIHDKEFVDHVETAPRTIIDTKLFASNYAQWFSRNKHIKGIENFCHIEYSNGTTETFDKFYHRFNAHRLRLYKGEYFYHQIMAKVKYQKNFKWVEEEDIKPGDIFVTSLPFADTGELPTNFYKILSQCEENDVPVLLDMAYFNISDLKNINLQYKCIDTITTSLSKVFPVEHYRIGIRLMQNFKDDSLVAYNENDYVNKIGISIGQHFIENFDNDYVVKKYRGRQLDACKKLNVDASNCVIFGIDRKNIFQDYSRGGPSNRLCFSRIWDGRVRQ